jgi:hypothetical protein
MESKNYRLEALFKYAELLIELKDRGIHFDDELRYVLNEIAKELS